MLTQYFLDQGLEDLVVVSPDAGRVKLNEEVRREDRRRAGDPQQGAPGPAGRRDRLRDRRRQGQDRRDRRRHDRHRRHAARRPPRRCSTRAPRASTPPPRTRCSPATPTRTSPPPRFEQIVVTDTIPLRAGAPDNIRVLSVRRPADRLDPPHLHRRLGERGLRRREPAVLSQRPPDPWPRRTPSA